MPNKLTQMVIHAILPKHSKNTSSDTKKTYGWQTGLSGRLVVKGVHKFSSINKSLSLILGIAFNFGTYSVLWNSVYIIRHQFCINNDPYNYIAKRWMTFNACLNGTDLRCFFIFVMYLRHQNNVGRVILAIFQIFFTSIYYISKDKNFPYQN